MKKIMLLICSLLVLVSCEQKVTQSKVFEKVEKVPVRIAEGLTVANARLDSVSKVKNELGFLYVNNNKLRFRTSKNKVVLDEGGNYSATTMWLISEDKYVYAFWWQKYIVKGNKKIKGKSLFVRGSDNYGKTFFPKVRINSAEGVLPDLDFFADDNGHISVIYNDERDPGYQVYVNSSNDAGKTWLEEDIRLDKALNQEVKQVITSAGTPRIIFVNNVMIAVWQQFDANNRKPITRIISRESLDYGLTWGNEKTIFNAQGDVASTFDIVVAGDELYLFWFDRKKKGLITYARKMDGEWISNLNIAPGTQGAFAISWLKGVADDDNVYIAYTFEKKPYKSYIKFIKLKRKEFSWDAEVVRLDQHANSLKHIAKSWDSDIALLPNGYVIVVWEDYEDIVPGIHLNYLNTKDNKWQANKKRIVKPGFADARSPTIFMLDNKVIIAFYYAEMKEIDRPPTTTIASLSYNFDESGISIDSTDIRVPSKVNSKKMIKKKAELLWKARIANDKEAEWKQLDPVYRVKFNKSKWLKSDSGLAFESATVDRITIQGLYAKVEGKVRYKMPKKMMESKVLDPEDKKKDVDPKKPVDSVYVFKYGWFNDDWYFVPEYMFMQHIDD